MSDPPAPEELLLVGRLTVPHGVRGQIKLHAITSHPEHLTRVKTIFVGDRRTAYRLQRLAAHKAATMIATLGGVETREAAEDLRGQEVYIRESDAQPLDEDEYFHHDLPGLRVEIEDGSTLGTVKEVIETGANDVLVVTRADGKEALVPMIRDVIRVLDIAAGRVVSAPLPGMLDD
jgi:16S rRNA processing protein RimM